MCKTKSSLSYLVVLVPRAYFEDISGTITNNGHTVVFQPARPLDGNDVPSVATAGSTLLKSVTCTQYGL